MKSAKKRIILLIVLVVVGVAIYYAIQAGRIATAYVAKIACSCTFVSGRPLDLVMKEDLSKYDFIKVSISQSDKTVTASAFELIKTKALFRKGLGCTLVNGMSEEDLKNQIKEDEILASQSTPEEIWPSGDSASTMYLPKEVDSLQLIEAMESAFLEDDSLNFKRTRATLVIYKGKIIGERYAKGINQETPLLGWSMTKSVTHALVGILVGQSKLNIKEKVPVKEWQGSDDERGKITLDQLMRMSSGLKFKEVYNIVSDATSMLFLAKSAAETAINKPLLNTPDSVWSYSSGTTNIISQIIRETLGGDQKDYLNFPRQFLFNKIGMRSAILEPDPSGTFVGSSFMYATARDWGRFGLLYLNDGIWKGERILPEGWVKYGSTPTPKSPLGQYGAHFWLNAGENNKGEERMWPLVPKDMFYASGFEGQNVVIIPSYELVIVRLGNTQNRKRWDIGVYVQEILKAFKKPKEELI